MKLPRGATGFWHVDEPVPAPVAVRAFRHLCHAAARQVGATITGHESNRVSAGPITVVCHELLPLIALIGPDSAFVDDPAWAALLDVEPFRLLSKEELDAPLSTADLSELHEVELKQIRHWKPDTVGEAIFNQWD